MGPVGFADTNSTMSFLPSPMLQLQKLSPSSATFLRTSEYHLLPMRKFMNPGPATSTLSNQLPSSFMFAISVSATLRGGMRISFALAIA